MFYPWQACLNGMDGGYVLRSGVRYETCLSRAELEQERVILPVLEKESKEPLPRTITIYSGRVDRPAGTDVEIKYDGSYSTIAVRMDDRVKRQVLESGSWRIDGPGITIDLVVG